MSFQSIADDIRSEAPAEWRDEINAVVDKAEARRDDIAKGVFPTRVHKSDADDGESGTGDFLDVEELIAAVLLSSWARKAHEAHAQATDALASGYTSERLDNALQSASRTLTNIVSTTDEKRLTALHRQAARRSAALVNGLQALDQYPRFLTLMENMARSAKYFTNGYFNTQVMPTIYRAVEDFIVSDGLTNPADVLSLIRERLDARLLRRTPYWHTVASSGASRAYHYGIIKAGRQLGYRGYRLVAILDQRTSDICIALDGKEFWLADAEQLYDRIAAAEEDAIKDIHPWITGEEKRGLTENEILSRAAYVPPFHGRCRTTMQLISV